MKTVVVTGASQGLGQSIAAAFLQAGWQVIGTGRSPRPAELGAAVDYRQFDASDAAACADFWQQLKPDGQVCLVNNAGGYVGGSLAEARPEDYARQMQSNYFAGVYMTQGLVWAIPQSRIINIISASALAPHAKNSAYGAAKAAAMHFFQAIQKEYPPQKYRITNLYPSSINSHGDNSDAIDPQDMAELVLELAQNQAGYYPTDMTLRPVPKQA